MKPVKQIDSLVKFINKIQQKNGLLGFLYAVIKKYGEDGAGYQAALLTYYGFLALFPLLLIVTTVAGIIGNSDPDLQDAISKGVSDYFPVLGNQLSEHVHTIHKSGLALILGILLTLYGARGVADVFRHSVNSIWRIPKEKQDGFPKSTLKSFGIVLVGGLGLLTASVSAGMAAAAGRGMGFRLLSIAINLFILFWVFDFLMNFSLPKHVTVKEIRPGAIAAAVGLVILQLVGGYILTRELKHLDALYSYFAISLGLLFWIYLQAQVLYYAVETASVKALKLWPRSLNNDPTEADMRSKPQVMA
jgi:YihY family inner membrane protein